MHRILMVDDEEEILNSFKRLVRKQYKLDVFSNPEEALKHLSPDAPYKVVISDYQMPQMKGTKFLMEVKKIIPDAARMLLTGQASMQGAITAVNQGQIFRFLTKPIDLKDYFAAVEQGIRQYELMQTERTLLKETLMGSLKVLGDVLNLVQPYLYGRATRQQYYLKQISEHLDIKDFWQIEVASILNCLSYIGLRQDIITAIEERTELNEEQKSLLHQAAKTAAETIQHIPRLDNVTKIIMSQNDDFSGESSKDFLTLPLVTQGVILLQVVQEFDRLVRDANQHQSALVETLAKHIPCSAEVVAALREISIKMETEQVKKIRISELHANMLLLEDIITKDNKLIMAKGQPLSQLVVIKIKQLSQEQELQEPITVKL